MADPIYQRSDLYIVLEFSPGHWNWMLNENGDNECVEYGTSESVQIAAEDACRAMDRACGVPPTT
jgi:hypothetical protein